MNRRFFCFPHGLTRKHPWAMVWICMFGVLPVLGNGCALGPDYTRPDVNLPATFQSASVEPSHTRESPMALAGWWEQFNDPVLSELVQRAVNDNPSLREALARVRQARARLRISQSDFFPGVTASASETISKSSDNPSRELYALGFDAAWELDIFGKSRRSVEAVTAELASAVDGYHDVMVSLISEVALNYVEYGVLLARLDAARSNLDILEQTLGLTRAKHTAGTATILDVKQAQSNQESQRASLPSLETTLAGIGFRLAVLLGDYPGAADALLETYHGLPDIPLELARSIPADLLLNRPDVRRAEHNLVAQTARIGVAMAERYPSVGLSGSIGLDALHVTDLFTADSLGRSIGARLMVPVFNAGALQNAVVVQESLADQAFYQYRSAVLTAVEEVENALTGFAKARLRLDALTLARDASAEAFAMVQDQYAAGLVDYQRVMDVQRALFSAKDQVISGRGDVMRHVIRLYKALGGGWSPLHPDEAQGAPMMSGNK